MFFTVRQLRDRNVLITGASRGIGRQIARLLAAEGARLALTARSASELDRNVAELKAAGATAYAFPADLTDPAQREAVVRRSVEALGGLDVLVNNAGLASYGQFDSSSEEVLRRIMEINFFVPAEMMRLCVRHLAEGRQPAILNLSSVCGRRGIPAWPEHSTSKFALAGLSEALRCEFARFGVDVLVVSPGVTRSDDLGRHLIRNEGKLRIDFEKAQPIEWVAKRAVTALKKNWKETVVGTQAWWLVRGVKWAPWFVDYMLARKVRQLYRNG